MIERILIADDQSIIRVGLSIMVKRLRPHSLVNEAVDYNDVLDLINKNIYNLIVLDINMPNGSFQRTFDIIKRSLPDTKVLVFSSQLESTYAARYLELGADGFLPKMADEKTVGHILEKVLQKDNLIRTTVGGDVEPDITRFSRRGKVSENPLTTLSNRETEIAEKLIRGESLKEISNELNLHSSTASTYKARIFKKLHVKNIPELIDVFRFYDGLID